MELPPTGFRPAAIVPLRPARLVPRTSFIGFTPREKELVPIGSQTARWLEAAPATRVRYIPIRFALSITLRIIRTEAASIITPSNVTAPRPSASAFA